MVSHLLNMEEVLTRKGGVLSDRVICVPLSSVLPYHPTRRWVQLEALTASMMDVGWKGRPIIAGEMDGGLRAITGSHRYAAAKEAGLQVIPVLVMVPDELQVALEAGAFQDDRVEALMSTGHRAIAELMHMDSLIPVMFGEDAARYPWDEDALTFYKRQGMLQEVIDVMAVEDWC